VQHRGGRDALRLPHQKVYVLGHDHIAHQSEIILLADFLQHLNHSVAGSLRCQQRQTPVTTERDEMQVTPAVVSLQVSRHMKGTEKPHVRPYCGRTWGTQRARRSRLSSHRRSGIIPIGVRRQGAKSLNRDHPSAVRKAVIASVLALGVAAFASATAWLQFESSTNFSVAYPGDWFRFGVSTDRLGIRSSRGGAEGVIIKRGQAMISVTEEEGASTETLAQVIEYYAKDTTVLSRRDISDRSHKQTCGNLEEVISRGPVIPAEDASVSVPNIVNTEFFCEADGHKILTVILRNWEDDHRQKQYQQVALRMARSIRLTQRN